MEILSTIVLLAVISVFVFIAYDAIHKPQQ